ncbi:protein of unknown function [Shewanella benthica]|uniref:Uncharacterized protein n=1 Tax=Shewanella benthica TaxID=43661 RepID=A0A330LZB6_9GAMM|nr:protein of unknown function [Shewanella benthica]
MSDTHHQLLQTKQILDLRIEYFREYLIMIAKSLKLQLLQFYSYTEKQVIDNYFQWITTFFRH